MQKEKKTFFFSSYACYSVLPAFEHQCNVWGTSLIAGHRLLKSKLWFIKLKWLSSSKNKGNNSLTDLYSSELLSQLNSPCR